jgi:hypothetical protein
MILRRRKSDLHLDQPGGVLAAVARLEVLTDRLEATTQTLKEMLESIHREEIASRGSSS